MRQLTSTALRKEVERGVVVVCCRCCVSGHGCCCGSCVVVVGGVIIGVVGNGVVGAKQPSSCRREW